MNEKDLNINKNINCFGEYLSNIKLLEIFPPEKIVQVIPYQRTLDNDHLTKLNQSAPLISVANGGLEVASSQGGVAARGQAQLFNQTWVIVSAIRESANQYEGFELVNILGEISSKLFNELNGHVPFGKIGLGHFQCLRIDPMFLADDGKIYIQAHYFKITIPFTVKRGK